MSMKTSLLAMALTAVVVKVKTVHTMSTVMICKARRIITVLSFLNGMTNLLTKQFITMLRKRVVTKQAI